MKYVVNCIPHACFDKYRAVGRCFPAGLSIADLSDEEVKALKLPHEKARIKSVRPAQAMDLTDPEIPKVGPFAAEEPEPKAAAKGK